MLPGDTRPPVPLASKISPTFISMIDISSLFTQFDLSIFPQSAFLVILFHTHSLITWPSKIYKTTNMTFSKLFSKSYQQLVCIVFKVNLYSNFLFASKQLPIETLRNSFQNLIRGWRFHTFITFTAIQLNSFVDGHRQPFEILMFLIFTIHTI